MNTLSYERGSLGRWAGAVLQETYRLGRLVGRGPIAEVYEAGHTRLPGNFLVKILHVELAANPEAFERLCREAEIISSLRHPHVIQIFDFSITAQGLPFYVTESLEGTDLRARIAERGARPPSEVSRVVDAVASALGAAHARGIVHGDLRPDRILFARVEGQDQELIKVLGFGGGGGGGGLGSRGAPARTLAPEQALEHDSPIDARSDQFALGALAYAMLTGRDAFSGDDQAEVLYRVVHETPPPIARFIAGDSAPLQDVLDRALAKHPPSRFPGVRELARALAAATSALEPAAALPLPAPEPVADPRAARLAERAPAALAGLEASPRVPAAVVDWELPSSVDRVPVRRTRAAALGVVALALVGLVVAQGWYRELPADLDFVRRNAGGLITRAEPRPQPTAPEVEAAIAPEAASSSGGDIGGVARTAPLDDPSPRRAAGP